ncbi:hypothetical protein AVEN_225309-1 [Araneus ventricosus]|uniref:Uncharacterized protein n=1 Tax=Araneus ventricosus TaxID=182803 RepID=A0A4Y2AN22_ARAVE|nr:hypothetical protein AVEN_225309-1 [Araneus ventricosus]
MGQIWNPHSNSFILTFLTLAFMITWAHYSTVKNQKYMLCTEIKCGLVALGFGTEWLRVREPIPPPIRRSLRFGARKMPRGQTSNCWCEVDVWNGGIVLVI